MGLRYCGRAPAGAARSRETGAAAPSVAFGATSPWRRGLKGSQKNLDLMSHEAALSRQVFATQGD